LGQQRGEVGGRARLAAVVWALSLSLAALAWVFSSPVGASPDEPAHLAYSWSVITGQGFGGPDDSCSMNPCPRFDVDIPPDFIPEPACYAFHPEQSSGCVSSSVPNPYPTYMTRYPPLYYYAVGASMWIADAGGMKPGAVGYAGRLGGTLLSLSVLIPAGVLAISRFRGALPLVVAAMTAMAWFMIGSVNPSGLEIAAAIAAAVAAGSLFRGRVESARWLFAYSVTLLAWARPVGFLWAGMIILFGIAFAATYQGTRDAFRSYGWSLIVGSATTLAAIGWFIYALGARAIGGGESVPTDPVERLFAISLRWGGMVWENAGVLGWLDTPLPDLVMISVIVLIAIIAADSARRIDSTSASRLMVAYVLTLILGITLLMAVQAFTWQGRYALPPMAAGFVLLGFTANPRQLWKTGRIAASILYTIAVTAAAWVYLRHAIGLEIASRYRVPAFASEATWSGPLGPWAVALLALGSAALMVWLLLTLADQQTDLDQVPTSSG
jgi:hypothetical protein